MPGRDAKEPVLHAIEAGLSPIETRPAAPRIGADNGLDARPRHEPETVPPVASEVLRPGSIEPDPVSLDARVRLQAFVAHVEPPPRRTTWANLLQRVFEIDALRCPGCGGRMRVLSAIMDPDVARRILECLKLPARAPPVSRTDEVGPVLEQASQAEPESFPIEETDPGFDFDKSPPGDAWV